MAGRDVLLVGSVPLRDAAAVFQTCSAILGDRLLALPDGETGARSHWIAWQKPLLAANPAVRELAEAGTYSSVAGEAPFRIDPAHRELSFGALGYAATSFLHPQRQFLHDALCGTRIVAASRPA